MLMYESLYAIGKFKRSLEKHLDFNHEYYKKTKNGISIISNVFSIESSIPRKAELAECLGIDPFDFNQHKIDPYSVDIDKMKKLFNQNEINAFFALRDAGFIFYYKPNS